MRYVVYGFAIFGALVAFGIVVVLGVAAALHAERHHIPDYFEHRKPP